MMNQKYLDKIIKLKLIDIKITHKTQFSRYNKNITAMEAELSCPLCRVQYCQQRPPRILSACGHSFCETCIGEKIISEGGNFCVVCPQDNSKSQLFDKDEKLFPINRSLLKIVQSNRIKTPQKDASFQLSKTTKQQEFQQEIDMHGFREAIDSNSIGVPSTHKTHFMLPQLQHEQQKQSDEEQNLCLLHQKPLEIVCIYDLQKVCAKCAIFGEHKGHEFKSLQQIQEEKQIFCDSIKVIFSLKQEITTRIQKKTTKTQILQILEGKVSLIEKQVKQNFNKLLQSIKQQQSYILKDLAQISHKISTDIDKLYQIQTSIIDNYQDWERVALMKLDLMENGSFEEQLKLLVKLETVKQKSTLTQGENIISALRIQEQNIINQSEALLSGIKLTVSDQIFGLVPTFINLQQKSKESDQNINISITDQLDIEKQHELCDKLIQKFSEINLLEAAHQHAESMEKVTFIQSPIKTVDDFQIKPESVKLIPFIEGKTFDTKSSIKSTPKKVLTKRQLPKSKIKTQSSQQKSSYTSRQNSFIQEKNARPTKKKLKSIKVDEKYQKILQALYEDKLETLDLTNAELGDTVILQICEFLSGSKVKTVKLIRNKITDEGLAKMLPFMENVITLNISQNLLSEKSLDTLIKNRQMVPKLKNLVLSMNKIIERRSRGKIDQLRGLQIVVSV